MKRFILCALLFASSCSRVAFAQDWAPAVPWVPGQRVPWIPEETQCGPNGCRPLPSQNYQYQPAPQAQTQVPVNAVRASVRIETTLPERIVKGRRVRPTHYGSGTIFYVQQGYGLVLTCKHVATENGVGAPTIAVWNPSTNIHHEARFISASPTADLAILLIGAEPGTPIAAVAAAGPQTGEAISQVGYPHATERPVTRSGRFLGQKGWQGSFASFNLSCQVDNGDSGSAVFNSAGQVVGVVWGKDCPQHPHVPQPGPGLTVGFGDVQTFVSATLDGPLLPWRRKIENQLQQQPPPSPVAPPSRPPDLTPIPSGPVPPPVPPAIDPIQKAIEDLKADIKSHVAGLKADIAGVQGTTNNLPINLGKIGDDLKAGLANGNLKADIDALAGQMKALEPLKELPGIVGKIAANPATPAVATGLGSVLGIGAAAATGGAAIPLVLALASGVSALLRRKAGPDGSVNPIPATPGLHLPTPPQPVQQQTAQTPISKYVPVPAVNLAEQLFQQVLDNEARNNPGTSGLMARLRSQYEQVKSGVPTNPPTL